MAPDLKLVCDRVRRRARGPRASVAPPVIGGAAVDGDTEPTAPTRREGRRDGALPAAIVTAGSTLDAPPATAVAMRARDLPPRIASFVIGERLGAGGMGAVHAALDERLGREVAIKVVRPDRAARESGSRRSERQLLAEAQALARLAHPNVVSIYEVGALPTGGVFVAMELIRGQSLRHWRVGRPWRAVLAAYIQAGRGLVAAHRAGVVHRDVKPDNILIGDDGRVRVVDFGLAIPASDSDVAPPWTLTPPSGEAQTVPAVTAAAIAGTPGYMAPEQHLAGAAIDARSDQFSFCVALYEAVYGERPYVDGTFHAACDAWPRGRKPRPVTLHARWLYDALDRGLSVDPARRFPSMDALLAVLDRERGRTARIAAIAATALLAGGALAATLLAERPEDPCPAPTGALAGVWDDGVRAMFRSTIEQSPLPWASTGGAAVVGALDRQARGWIDARIAACRATHVDHVQSAALLDRRIECLDARHRELAAAAAMAREQPLAAAARAEELGDTLHEVAACNDLAALGEAPAPPRPSQVGAVAQAQRHLARGTALLAAGDVRAARMAIELASVPTGYASLDAQVLASRARLAIEEQRTELAIQLGERAANAALATRQDELLADVWLGLALEIGGRSDHTATATRWLDGATAALHRLGRAGDPRTILVEIARGRIQSWSGQPALAVATLSSALVTATLVLGKRHPWTFRILHTRANAWAFAGDPGRALDDYRSAIAIGGEALGPDHPKIGRAHRNLALHLIEAVGDREAAARELATCLRIARGEGESSLNVALCQLARAQLALYQGDPATGKASAQEALAIFNRESTAPDRRRAEALNALGAHLFIGGEPAAALPMYRDALAEYLAIDASAGEVASARLNLAEAALAVGDAAQASDEAERALAVLRAQRPEPGALSFGLQIAGQAALALGRDADAVALMESALARLTSQHAAQERADVRWALARALRGRGAAGDRGRARRLAAEALAAFRELGAGGAARRAEIESWLRAPPI